MTARTFRVPRLLCLCRCHHLDPAGCTRATLIGCDDVSTRLQFIDNGRTPAINDTDRSARPLTYGRWPRRPGGYASAHSPTRSAAAKALRSGFETEHGAILHVRGEIEKPVGSLLHVTDALTQFVKQYLPPALQSVRVENDP